MENTRYTRIRRSRERMFGKKTRAFRIAFIVIFISSVCVCLWCPHPFLINASPFVHFRILVSFTILPNDVYYSFVLQEMRYLCKIHTIQKCTNKYAFVSIFLSFQFSSHNSYFFLCLFRYLFRTRILNTSCCRNSNYVRRYLYWVVPGFLQFSNSIDYCFEIPHDLRVCNKRSRKVPFKWRSFVSRTIFQNFQLWTRAAKECVIFHCNL